MNNAGENSAGPGRAGPGQETVRGRRVIARVRGIVQGVGFRPFVYQLALHHGLGGWVRNQADGVEIEVSGTTASVTDFISEISSKPPPLARVTSVDVSELPYAPLDGFRILTSSSGQARSTLISPDVCTCSDCIRELLNPFNRRHRYPFINCTNCGPRYTIIKDIPYDREKTTMAGFTMCPDCRAEYEDPLDRRFHAQPDACWECGPRVWLEDGGGAVMAFGDAAVRAATKLLATGSVMAIKGLGGFHLAVAATDEAAVSRLRSRKIREEKPFAVMFESIEEIRAYCLVGDAEEKLLSSRERPIVLLQKIAPPESHPSPEGEGGPETHPPAGAEEPRHPSHPHSGAGEASSENPPTSPPPKTSTLGLSPSRAGEATTSSNSLPPAGGKGNRGAPFPNERQEEFYPTGIQSPGSGDHPPLAPGVAPGNRYLGAFLPYTPLHVLLFEGTPYSSLVMTSGNQSDEPIVITNEDARLRLRGIADFFLIHDRDIYIRCDDSVMRVVGEKIRPIRRARGYVPVPVFLGKAVPSVLGTGAELKNTVCITRGREAFLSQHIGDLENLETLSSFEHAIEHLQRILEVRPELVVHDMHPDYLSTQWALRQDALPLLAVQHHHAHIASVMAEKGLEGPVLGIALDGTGFGTDGTIWGGEVLRVDSEGFERLGHFRHVLLPGGAKAIKEPWRMALSYLWSIDAEHTESRFFDIVDKWPAGEIKILLRMLARKLNSPVTSSCGRLFDAVAALCGVRDRVNYEGQAAVELEQALVRDKVHYEGRITVRDGGAFIIDPFPIVNSVIEDMRRKLPVGRISARFHNGIVRLIAEAARHASARNGIKTVALSGGVFQNAYLAQRLEGELSDLGFEVFSHSEVPPNDACISLGQAFIGAGKLTGG